MPQIRAGEYEGLEQKVTFPNKVWKSLLKIFAQRVLVYLFFCYPQFADLCCSWLSQNGGLTLARQTLSRGEIEILWSGFFIEWNAFTISTRRCTIFLQVVVAEYLPKEVIKMRHVNPRWGGTVTGARKFLIAYNINMLSTKEQAHR